MGEFLFVWRRVIQSPIGAYGGLVLAIAMMIVGYLLIALSAWAFIDCLLRPAAAFPAVDRQTKVAWLIFIGVALAAQIVLGQFGFLGMLAAVVAVFYLVDVRAKVVEITRGNR